MFGVQDQKENLAALLILVLILGGIGVLEMDTRFIDILILSMYCGNILSF